MIRVSHLNQFHELFTRLGGNAGTLLAHAGIAADRLSDPDARLPQRSYVQLLEHAARDLDCRDFGIRLAIAQRGLRVFGPLGYVVRHAPTLGEALQYCVAYGEEFGTAVSLSLERGCFPLSVFLRIHHQVRDEHAQHVERALMLLQLAIAEITDGNLMPRDVWFSHQAVSSLTTYKQHFGPEVRFN